MTDKKSKLPDLSEISSMAGKLFKDVKNSVCEIIDEYKSKRNEDGDSHPEKNSSAKKEPKDKH